MIETRTKLLKQNHSGIDAYLLLSVEVVSPSLELVRELDVPFHWRTITPMELPRNALL
jgi:hypothetical protein